MKRNLILLTTVLILAGGCGEATDKPVKLDTQPANSSSTISLSTSDHSNLVKACMKFETRKVCNCIANTLETELDAPVLKKVAENARNGSVTPLGWQKGLSATERESFGSGMKSWNASCELN